MYETLSNDKAYIYGFLMELSPCGSLHQVRVYRAQHCTAPTYAGKHAGSQLGQCPAGKHALNTGQRTVRVCVQ